MEPDQKPLIDWSTTLRATDELKGFMQEFLNTNVSTSKDPSEEDIVEDPDPDADDEGPVAISEVLTAKGLTSRQQAMLLRGTWMTGLNSALPIKDIPDKQLLILIKAHTEQKDGTSPEKYYELKLAAMQRGLI